MTIVDWTTKSWRHMLKRHFFFLFSGRRKENKQTRNQHHRSRIFPGPVPITGRKLFFTRSLLQWLHTTQRQRTGLQVSGHFGGGHCTRMLHSENGWEDCYLLTERPLLASSHIPNGVHLSACFTILLFAYLDLWEGNRVQRLA